MDMNGKCLSRPWRLDLPSFVLHVAVRTSCPSSPRDVAGAKQVGVEAAVEIGMAGKRSKSLLIRAGNIAQNMVGDT